MALLTAFPLRRPPQALLPLQLPLLPPHPRLRLLPLPLPRLLLPPVLPVPSERESTVPSVRLSPWGRSNLAHCSSWAWVI